MCINFDINRCVYNLLVKADIKVQVAIQLKLPSIISKWGLSAVLNCFLVMPATDVTFLKNSGPMMVILALAPVLAKPCAGTPATSTVTFLGWLPLSLTHAMSSESDRSTYVHWTRNMAPFY